MQVLEERGIPSNALERQLLDFHRGRAAIVIALMVTGISMSMAMSSSPRASMIVRLHAARRPAVLVEERGYSHAQTRRRSLIAVLFHQAGYYLKLHLQ